LGTLLLDVTQGATPQQVDWFSLVGLVRTLAILLLPCCCCSLTTSICRLFTMSNNMVICEEGGAGSATAPTLVSSSIASFTRLAVKSALWGLST